ncbi:response regulator [Devosia rhodophyticola]|uniref:Response regulator n=1 Tax=Devosia rhodophyticola TaxID=3026423 RepID=A0ABY7Z0T6_9HYPH|nr:response regulator [Devosia rhodophyticola]WDR06630.1 response regulator [Devosia rhodophyticola]
MQIPGKIKALVVDDNAYARAIASLNFGKLGVTDVDEAMGGAEAILALLSKRYDVMLMDWYMPDVSGAGVLHVLRDTRFGPASTTPVILMTAYASRENIVRAREIGVDAILVKPFTAEQLGMAMNRVLTPIPRDDAETADEIFL